MTLYRLIVAMQYEVYKLSNGTNSVKPLIYKLYQDFITFKINPLGNTQQFG